MRAGPLVAGVAALALVVRLALVVATPHYAPATDAADYDAIAVSLARGDGFPRSTIDPAGGPSAFRPPAFPVLLAGVYRLVGVGSASARWTAGRVLEALLGAVVVGLLALLALRVWGLAAALAAGALAAFYPPLVLVGSSLMVEPLFIALELGAVLAALEHRRTAHGARWAAASGVLVGLAALTRGNGIVLLIPLGLLLRSPRRGLLRSPRPGLRRRAPAIAILLAILTVAPWEARDLAAFHHPVPLITETGYALAGTYNSFAQGSAEYPALWVPPGVQIAHALAGQPPADEAQLASRLEGSAIGYIEAHPVSLARTAVWSALRLLDLTGPGLERVAAAGEAYPPWLAVLSVYAFWVLAAVALAGGLTRAARLAPAPVWGFPATVLLSTVLVIGTTRYRSPADPFFVLLAALALTSLRRRLADSRAPIRLLRFRAAPAGAPHP